MWAPHHDLTPQTLCAKKSIKIGHTHTPAPRLCAKPHIYSMYVHNVERPRPRPRAPGCR